MTEMLCSVQILHVQELRWHVSQQKLTKVQTWGTVMTGVCPSFRVEVSFKAIILCLILNWYS